MVVTRAASNPSARQGPRSGNGNYSESNGPEDIEQMAHLVNSASKSTAKGNITRGHRDPHGRASSPRSNMNGGPLSHSLVAAGISGSSNGIRDGKRKTTSSDNTYDGPPSPTEGNGGRSKDLQPFSKRAKLSAKTDRSSSLPESASTQAPARPKTRSNQPPSGQPTSRATGGNLKNTRSRAVSKGDHDEHTISTGRKPVVELRSHRTSEQVRHMEREPVVDSDVTTRRRGRKRSKSGTVTSQTNGTSSKMSDRGDAGERQNDRGGESDQSRSDHNRAEAEDLEDVRTNRNVQENTGIDGSIPEEEEDIELPENPALLRNSSQAIPEGSDIPEVQEDVHSTESAYLDEEYVEEELPSDRMRALPNEEDHPEFHVCVKNLVEQMLENSKHTGHAHNGKRWKKVHKEDHCWTIEGKRLVKRLDSLATTYKNLQNARRAAQPAVSICEKVKAFVKSMQEVANTVLTKRLGQPRDGKPEFAIARTTAMLIDLYYMVIPKLLTTLSMYAEDRMSDNDFDLDDLKGSLALAAVLNKLLAVALIQPPKAQPTTTTGKGPFEVLKPNRQIQNDAAKLRRAIQSMLKKRELAATRRERERLAKKHERLAKEREQAARNKMEEEQEERRRKIRERHRAQWAHLRAMYRTGPGLPYPYGNMRPHAADAPGSPELDVPHRAWRQLYVLDADEDGFHHLNEEALEDSDPFAGELDSPIDQQIPERVQVFGKDNAKNANIPRRWTEEEKAYFIDVMRIKKDRPDRYIKLAEDLDRSEEEIFALAKDLQEAMDVAHEKGKFNEPCDDWTYEIYVRSRREV